SLSASPSKSTFKDRIFRLIYPTRCSTHASQKTFFSLFLLILFVGILTNCVKNENRKFDLPSTGDLVEQLYTDNQANHKVQVFGFKKSDSSHDLLVISTIEGTPLHAYLDGNIVNDKQLKELYGVLNQRRTISPQALLNMPESGRAVRYRRTAKLNHELDSINAEIKLIKNGKDANVGAKSKNMSALNEGLNSRAEEIKKLSMEDYKEDVKNIDIDVKLHKVLTNIITNMQYTKEQHIELMGLINQRNSRT
ncbi:MAG TPA: hypothetical protein PLS50_09015, partial [Candidatus Dojkabacteria bacterium]|nr:hypothetical protein [Candidatus Dojkabacteria bacterium]